MPYTFKGFLCSSGNWFFADHAYQLFLVYQAVDTRHSLISCDGREVFQGLEVLIYHDNERFIFFCDNLLLVNLLNRIDDTIRDDCVEYIDHVYLIW